MKLSELKECVDWHYDERLEQQYPHPADIQVGIVVQTVGSIGGTPTVTVKSINAGFDWDAGKLLIYPEKLLRTIEADELLALRKANEKQGWAEYENRGLKAEVKRLRKQLDEANRDIP
jgi:hypothetical protein